MLSEPKAGGMSAAFLPMSSHSAAIRRVDDLNRCIPAKIKVLRRGNAVFQRRGLTARDAIILTARRKSKSFSFCILLIRVFFSVLHQQRAADTAPAAATIPMGMST